MPMNNRLLRPRQTIHPEAADWANRVRTNGGSVSGTTLSAVDRFVKAIHAAGIRDRFYRLNLFCGNSDANLAAVRTPLFRGPSLTGTQFGDATDANNNFVIGDYTETGASGGLVGNGSNKYLATGYPQNTQGETGHTSAYHRGSLAALATGSMLRVISVTGGNSHITGMDWQFSLQRTRLWWGSNTQPANNVDGNGGHFIGSRTSSTNMAAYRNGVLVETNTNAVTPVLKATPYPVFASDNEGSGIVSFFAGRLQAYSIGEALTASQAASFSTAMIAFQTALGRN